MHVCFILRSIDLYILRLDFSMPPWMPQDLGDSEPPSDVYAEHSSEKILELW